MNATTVPLEPCDGCGMKFSKLALQYHKDVCSSRSRSRSTASHNVQNQAPQAAATTTTTMTLSLKNGKQQQATSSSPTNKRQILQASNAKHRHALRELRNEMHHEPSSLHFEPTPRSKAEQQRQRQQQQQQQHQQPAASNAQVYLTFDDDDNVQQPFRSASNNAEEELRQHFQGLASKRQSPPPSNTAAATAANDERDSRSPDVPYVVVRQQQQQQAQQQPPPQKAAAAPTSSTQQQQQPAVTHSNDSHHHYLSASVRTVQKAVEELSLDLSKWRAETRTALQQQQVQHRMLMQQDPPSWAVELKNSLAKVSNDVEMLKEQMQMLLATRMTTMIMPQHQNAAVATAPQMPPPQPQFQQKQADSSRAVSEIDLLRQQVQAIHATHRERSSVSRQRNSSSSEKNDQNAAAQPSTPIPDELDPLLAASAAEDIARRGMGSAQRALRSDSVHRTSVERAISYPPPPGAPAVPPRESVLTHQQLQMLSHNNHHNNHAASAATPLTSNLNWFTGSATVSPNVSIGGRTTGSKRVVEV